MTAPLSYSGNRAPLKDSHGVLEENLLSSEGSLPNVFDTVESSCRLPLGFLPRALRFVVAKGPSSVSLELCVWNHPAAIPRAPTGPNTLCFLVGLQS